MNINFHKMRAAAMTGALLLTVGLWLGCQKTEQEDMPPVVGDAKAIGAPFILNVNAANPVKLQVYS
ncbi:MAG TPA: hypothetical protein VKG92_00395, partial [Flavobacteriales bacterium]|nr:hypothetical protein [Flavobacteriales bacterium]